MSKLLPAEQACLDHLAKAWNEFVGLDVLNGDDLGEFRHGIHALQNMVMARPVRVELKRQAAAERMRERVNLCHMDGDGVWLIVNECHICGGTGTDTTRGNKACDGIPF